GIVGRTVARLGRVVAVATGDDHGGARDEDQDACDGRISHPHMVSATAEGDHGRSSAASVPPRSYAASRCSSVTSPITSSVAAACFHPSAPVINNTDRTAPVVS